MLKGTMATQAIFGPTLRLMEGPQVRHKVLAAAMPMDLPLQTKQGLITRRLIPTALGAVKVVGYGVGVFSF